MSKSSCKHEDMCLDPSTQRGNTRKKKKSQVWPHVCCRMGIGGSLGPLGSQPSSRFHERPCLEGIRPRVTDEKSSSNPSLHACVPAHTLEHTNNGQHTGKNRMRSLSHEEEEPTATPHLFKAVHVVSICSLSTVGAW